jgi:hypothetical protein
MPPNVETAHLEFAGFERSNSSRPSHYGPFSHFDQWDAAVLHYETARIKRLAHRVEMERQ